MQGTVILVCKDKGMQSEEALTHRMKDTPATKLVFCRKSFSKSLFFMTTHYIDVHILEMNVLICFLNV